MDPRPRVTVVMGGPSAEHDISLKSGKGVLTALIQRGWPADPLVIPKGITVEDAIVSTRQVLATGEPDVGFIACTARLAKTAPSKASAKSCTWRTPVRMCRPAGWAWTK